MSLKIVNIVRNHWSRHNVIVPFGSVTTIHACSTGSDQAPTVSTPPKQKLLKRSGRRQLKELKQAVQDVIPYPEVKIRARPEDRAVVLFGGESSEYVGMVEDTLDLPQVRQLYETAEKKFNIDFIDISLNGPVERLHDLEYNHMTIFLANAAG